ncbi:MAG: eL32 family ribosomal protein [Candidatus Nanoarchaeia archaeon]|jgi:large subunit ribosomal protein L32e
MSEELIKAKQSMKKKLPKFRRVEKHRHPQLPDNWRKPKGHHSKIRRAMKWEMRIPKIGMKTPKALQNLDKFGRELILIRTINDLKKLSEKTVGIVAAKLGLKKRLMIANQAIGKKYKFLNFNPEKIIQKVEDNKKAKKPKPKLELKETAEQKPAEKPSKPIIKPQKPKNEEKTIKPKGDKQ